MIINLSFTINDMIKCCDDLKIMSKELKNEENRRPHSYIKKIYIIIKLNDIYKLERIVFKCLI